MAPSIPSWKYFIFGGSVGSFDEGSNRTISKFVKDSYYFDVNAMDWKIVNLVPDEGSKAITYPK